MKNVLLNRQLIVGSDVITTSEMFCEEKQINKQANKKQPTLVLGKKIFVFI